IKNYIYGAMFFTYRYRMTKDRFYFIWRCTCCAHAQLKGGNKEPYRIGLKLSNGGWVYVQGLTHFEINEHAEFLIAGFNYEGQLAAALQISERPFNL
ncbi:DUF1806 family protein, partial [Staphylococcus aureus]